MEKGHTIKVLDKGFVRLVDWMGTDARIAEAARVSYGDYKDGRLVAKERTEEQDTKLLHTLYRLKHTSPFEMVKVTLDFKMPIFVARQYIRHRMQNVNEYSMRYKEAPDEFYVPGDLEWRAQDPKNKQGSVGGQQLRFAAVHAVRDVDGTQYASDSITTNVEQNGKNQFQFYKEMIGAGVAREQARMVLPFNLYTYFYATWDIKNLLHFVTLREDSHAQAEIQEYGRAVKAILEALFPRTLECFERYKFLCVDLQDPSAILDEIAKLQISYIEICNRKGTPPAMVKPLPVSGTVKFDFKGVTTK